MNTESNTTKPQKMIDTLLNSQDVVAMFPEFLDKILLISEVLKEFTKQSGISVDDLNLRCDITTNPTQHTYLYGADAYVVVHFKDKSASLVLWFGDGLYDNYNGWVAEFEFYYKTLKGRTSSGDDTYFYNTYRKRPKTAKEFDACIERLKTWHELAQP